MRAYFFVILLLLVIFGAIGGYLFQRFSAFGDMDFSPPPVTIAASIAVAETWDTHLDAVGSIRAVQGVELTSETSGEITAIHFDSGQTVDAGQLLLVLNDEIEQASKQNNQAGLELADILFRRDSQLIAQKSIPQSQFDRSRADLARAKAQLAETEARISNKRIEAPFAGTMGIRRVNVGDYLAPGTLIATLQNAKALEIDFTLPAQHAPLLEPGLLVQLTVNAFPNRQFKAHLTAVDSRVDPGTRNILVRARLAETKGLVPGMFAKVQLDLNQTKSVVTVPETAITYSLQGNTIYLITTKDDGGLTAEARIVETGTVREGRVSVTSGILAGDRVATAGQNKLYRGVSVLVDESIDL